VNGLRIYVFSHALLFVAGFILVFVLVFGIPTTVLGTLLYDYRNWITRIGGLLLIVLGLHMAGFFKALVRLTSRGGEGMKPFRDAVGKVDSTLDSIILPEHRLQIGHGHSPSYARSALVGVTFAAGWTPCVGPLLGLVLTMAATEPMRAVPLLLIYSMGLAVPFLLTAALLSTAVGFLKRINRYLHAIELLSGVLLVVVGGYLVRGDLSQLNRLASAVPAWLTNVESGFAGGTTISVPLAFLAGLLSFLSPCVLPLVPIYLGYLTGTTVATKPEQRQSSAPPAPAG
jgi:cytochrome c-type biogenesis protein